MKNIFLQQLLIWLHRIENTLAVITLAAILLISVVQILLRNIFDGGIVWADQLIRILIFWLAMTGALIATRERKQITIDVLTKLLPPDFVRWTRALVYLVTGMICLLLAWHSWRFVQFEIEFATPGLMGLPAWVYELILPVALLIIALRYSLYAISAVVVSQSE